MRIAKLATGLAIASLLLTGGVAMAQSTTTSTTTVQITDDNRMSGTTTPGAPNTGAGGDATGTALLIGVSALVVLGGLAYLAYRAAAPSQL